MKFIGRISELKKLNNIIHLNNVQLSLIYGRRRVGKSELIKQTLVQNNIKNIYYECKQTTEMNNVESLSLLIAEMFNLPKLGFNSIEEILNYLFKYSENENLILVLDEYPYLRENVKGLDSILKSLIDKYRNTSKLKIIISGSYVDIMRSLTEISNPLYGRIDLIINLKPMDYYESSLFYPTFSDEDKVKLYSVFGGIPYYNQLIDSNKSVKDNIIDLVASPGARLESEVIIYIKSEISKIVNANETFEAMAKGYSRFKDIRDQSNVSSGPTLIDVLDKLIDMDVVTKVAPINFENNKQKAGYYISDNLSNFYYKYIFKHLSQMQIMDPEVFYAKYIEQDFEEHYVPSKFEDIAKQYLIRKNRMGLLEPVFEKIGKYYYDDPVNKTNGEFDVVTEDSLGYVFYEVKFKKGQLSKADILEEINQVINTNLNCYKYVFITKSLIDLPKGIEDYHIEHIKLNELY